MKCYQSATAIVESGTAGYILVVKVKCFTGFVPPALIKREPPFNPKNVFPVVLNGGLSSPTTTKTPTELEVNYNLNNRDEFDSVEIFCGDEKPGTIIPVSKK